MGTPEESALIGWLGSPAAWRHRVAHAALVDIAVLDRYEERLATLKTIKAAKRSIPPVAALAACTLGVVTAPCV
jgi:hypothetical protein